MSLDPLGPDALVALDAALEAGWLAAPVSGERVCRRLTDPEITARWSRPGQSGYSVLVTAHKVHFDAFVRWHGGSRAWSLPVALLATPERWRHAREALEERLQQLARGEPADDE